MHRGTKSIARVLLNSARLPLAWRTFISLSLLLVLGGCSNGFLFTGDHTDKDNYALKIDPAAPVITVKHTVQLTASSPWGGGAQWSVLPSAAGSIDGNGMFTAGVNPADATLVAMWKDDVRYTATAKVQIVAAPVADITVTSSTFTINTPDSASVTTQTGSNYWWTITNGSITSGQGTPSIEFTSNALGSVQITCTVTNAAGDHANGQASATVIDLSPVIAYAPGRFTVTRGRPITPIGPSSTGGDPVTWTISPGLPSGLIFNTATGQITGTSANLGSAQTFTVTATNSGGSTTASITLTTVDVTPAVAYNPAVYTFTRGTAIPAVTPTVTGGTITSWSVAPALSAGLSFNSVTGVITGNPTEFRTSNHYTVTATNSGGTATADLTFTVVDPSPVVAYVPSTETFVRGAGITAMVPTNIGGPAVSWQISPGLPAGLTFDATTGAITGNPTTPTAAATYSVTATNSGGTSNTFALSLTVVDSAPVFSYVPAAYTVTVNSPIAPIAPTLTHGTATSWSIAPSLPAGLFIDPATGIISGTPTVLSPAGSYTVTARNDYGSSSTSSVSITVIDTPPVIHYNPSAFSITKGTAAPSIVPTNTGGAALSWAISPSLPAGLVFNPNNGDISGTPTGLSPSATYSVTATNTGGTSQPVILSFAVVDVVPRIGYSPSVFIFTKGTAITPVVPANNGGSATSWSISPSLPAGLFFDSATGIVTGTPTGLSSAISYTVTATNTGGSSTPLSLTISVVDVVPVIAYPLPTVTVSVGSPLSVLIATNTGGTATSWSISPALPAGLTFDSSTGHISGNPTGPLPSTTFSITATNTGGTSQPYVLTLDIVARPSASLSASTTTPLFGATVALTPTFAGSTSASVGSTRAAADFSAAPASGVALTSAPITAASTFWLRATNAANDSVDASVTVTPQTVVVSPIFPAAPTVTASGTVTFSATVNGGATNALKWTATGGIIDASTGAWTAPSSAGTVTVTATSKDDPTKSSSTLVTVVLASTSSITASTNTPLFGASVTVTPTFTGATSASVGTSRGASDISASPATGVAIPTSAITSATTFWLRTTNAAGDSQDSSVLVSPQIVAVSPVAPAAPTRTVSTSTTFSTTATGGATNALTWSVAGGGSIDAATGVFTAPASPATVTVKATSTDDPTKFASTTVNIVAAGTAAITASTNTPLFGATVNLTPTFSNVVSAVVGTTPGASDISTSATTGVSISTSALTTPKTFYLHVTNAAGTSTDASVTVAPQTVIVNPISPASPTRSVSTSTTFTATATGGVTNGIKWTASGGGSIDQNTGVFTAPSTTASVLITATSKDDTSKSATTTVTVVALATASIASSNATPLYGDTVNITSTFANTTTAVIGTTAAGSSDFSASPTSGTAIATAALTSAKTFYLRATNSAGTNTDVSTTVTPKTVTITAITGSSNKVSVGYTATVKTTVTNAVDTTVNWTATAGSFSATNTASGVTTTWTAPAGAGTYTITGTSNADSSKHVAYSITVYALPVSGSLNPSTTSPLFGATISLTPVFSNGNGATRIGTTGAGSSDLTSNATSGTAIASSSILAPTTFTLTVTNSAGQTASSSSGLITPQTVSVDTPAAAQSFLTTGYSQAYATTVHGALNTAVTWSSNGGTWSGSTWTAPSTTGSYTITATSVADTTKSASTTVTVVKPPVITSFTAADPLLSLNHSTTLTAVYTNGNGTARIGTGGTGSSQLTNSPTSGTAFSTGNLAATTTYTLTAYNEAGNSTSATLNVTVVAGSSSSTVSLTSPRYAHTSTLLPDGRVLVIGGHSDSAALNTSQIYDPSVPSFSDSGTMTSARFNHTATLLANNTVLVTGGDNGSGSVATTELWNGPSFTSTAALNSPREKHTATLLLNGKVLVVGGLNGSSPTVTAELFDPSTGTFTYTAGNLNTARYSHTATLLANGKVLIAGGYNGSVPLKSAELFDPSTGAFTVVGSMNTARQRHAAVLLSDGTVAVIGGQGASAPLANAEIFNAGTNSFTLTSGSMASARDNPSATLIASGKVIVAGGIDGSGTPVKGSEILDPTAGTFGLTALLSTARSQHTATLLQNGQILLVGGLALSGATSTAELIDPQDGLTPTIPDATLTAPIGANRAQTGLAASAPTQTHVSYVWMITGGTITAGQGTAAVTFAMPSTGTATLDVLVTSDRVVPSHTRFVVTAKPAISAFAPTKATVTVGTATNLNWTVQDATSLSVDQSVGTVTGTFTPVTVGSLGTTTYTLTATNAGGSVTATTSILAVPAPIAASLTSSATTVPVGGNTTLTPVFSQGTGVITPGLGTVSSGPAYPTPAISTPTTFTLTVTNTAGDTATQIATIGLQPVSVTSISGAATVTSGHLSAYTATVSGSVNTAVTWQTSAGSIDSIGHLTAPTGPPYSTGATPITLTATSVNGGTPATFTVIVIPPPSITSFTANPATANYGGSTTITPVFTLGTGAIANIGSVTSGQAVASGILTASKTFTLTVTNAAGDSVSQDLTVVQATPSVSTPTPANSSVSSGDVVAFSATTSGSANTTVIWTADGGTFSGSNWTAPANPGTYNISAHSVSPSGYSASTTVTVVAAPSIAAFTASAYTLSQGSTTNILATFAGGNASINPGSMSPTSGTSFASAALSSTTSYTLTVTNSLGKSVTRSFIVNVVRGGTIATGSMAANRVGHTVTLLTDGTVLIAGGSTTSTSAEIYNATTQTFIATSSAMQAARTHQTATLLANGKVLLAGGSGASPALNSAEIYDPATGTFTATSGTMTSARVNHTAALMPDGRVFLSGGNDASSNALSSAEIYDPVTDSFAAVPAMSSAREFATANVLSSGSVLITGGDVSGTPTASTQIFDGSAYTSGNLNQARTQHTSTTLSGGSNALLVGGSTGSSPLASTEFFNGSIFSSNATLPSARFGHTALYLASGNVLVTGGSDGSQSLASSAIIDPSQSLSWSTADLSAARFQPSATILRSGKVLITGGASNPSDTTSGLSSTEIFDPQDNLTPILPAATLTAPSSAPANATGLTASVPAQSNVRYVWSIINGTITAGLNTRSITFNRGTGPSVLSVLVISDRQVPMSSSVTISAAPSISSFTATPSTSTIGSPVTLTWSATGGTGLTLSINNGVGDVTSLGGTTTVTTPSSTTTYTLTATDSSGNSATKTVTVTAVAVPVASSLTAAVNPIEKGSSTTVIPVFSAGTATIDNGVGAVTSGVAYPSGTLNASTTYTLTVTNAAGTSVTRTLALNVMPVVVGAISGPANVTVSSTSAQFSTSVTGSVDKSVIWSASGGTITSAGRLTAPATSGDIIVTATSNADSSQHNQITVHVVTNAVATGITAATNPVLYGGSTTITPQFSLGSGVIDQGIGSVNSGTAYTTGTITTDKTFTLTVTNAAGDTATFPFTIHPQIVTVSTISGPSSGYVTVGHTAPFNATVSGAVDTSLTWTSAGAGTFSNNVWTAPSTPGTYTITATAVNGATNTLSITVVAAPVISVFTATPPGINKNQSSTLTATFTGAGTGSNATGVVTPGNLSLSTGGSGVGTGALATSQTYSLTVTNNAGDTATAQTTVQVFLGAFSATSNSLNSARNLPSATLDGDGKVLVAGGGTASTSADLFDGTALTFAATGALATGRSGHTATILPTGLILIAGGYNGTSALSSAELYDPSTGTFTATGSLKQARRNHRAILLDSGKVLLIGGTGLSSAEIYDPSTGTFALTGSMVSIRDSAAASRLPDGRILVAGGSDGSSRLSSAEIYDTSTSSFSTAGSMLHARQFHTATNLTSGQILIAGGTGNTSTGSAEIFNPSLMRFTATGDMIQPRQQHVGVLLPSGMVLIAGGNNGSTSAAIDQAELFDPSNSVFIKTDFMSTTGSPATGGAATILPSGQVLVTGGTSDGSATIPGSELYTSTDGLAAAQADPSITASKYVPQAAAGVAAHVTAAANARYIWTVTNGTLASGQGTPSITFNMPATGNAILDVLLLTDHQVPSHNQAFVVGEPAPVITGFTAASSSVAYGGFTTLTPVFSGATSSAVIGTGALGSSDISAYASTGVAVPVGPLTAPRQYRLTLTNHAGITSTQTVSVAVQTIIVSAISPANPTVSVNASKTFSASVTQAANTGITWSASGGVINASTGAWTAPSTPGTYTIKATSQADNTTYASTSANVVALPAIQSFIASPTAVNYGLTSSLTPTFTGALGNKASIGTSGAGSNQLTGTAITANAVTTPALNANTTYTLTVTNAAGDSVTATATVNVTQPFSATGSLALARNGQSSTLLADGSVLIAGGTTSPDKAEIYTTSGGTFALTQQPMQAARRNHTATLLATGQVLLTGGSDTSGSAQNTAELFDPSTSTFTATAGTMAHARVNHAATLLQDGSVLIIGGSNSAEGQLASAEIFNPTTGTFTPVATALSSPRSFASATTLTDGRVLVAGGHNGTTHLSSADIFSAGAFLTPALSMGSTRSHHTATLLPSGQVLLAGGSDGSAQLSSATLFAPGSSTDTFTAVGSMSTGRQDATATLLTSGKVLVAGGFSSSTGLSTAELFNPTTSAFAITGSLLTARSGAGSNLLLDGTALVLGGTTNGTSALSSAERFDPQDSLTPFIPDATLVPSVSYAYAGTTGLTATVPSHAGNRFVWTVRNGTVTAGQGTSTITFSLSSSGDPATVDVLVVSDHLVPTHGRVTVASDALPVLTSFTAAMNPVLYGGSTTITPVFSNATGVKLGTSGSGSSDVSTSVTSGTAISVGPLTSSTPYTLTFPLVAGTHTTQTLTVNVTPVTVSAITPAAPSVTGGHTQTFTSAVSGAVNSGLTWSATGGSITSGGLWTAPSTPGTYTVTARAAADNTTAASTTVTVIAAPAIQSFTAAAASIARGSATTLTPTFTGGQATIGTNGSGSYDISAAATSRTGISTSALTSTTTFTLTVTNGAGDTVTQTTQVAVIQPFTSTGAMALARSGQTTTALPDGTVLVAGGTTSADPAEVYTEGSATFASTSAMTSARRGQTATLLPGGKVLLAGGSDGSNNTLSSAEIYDPATHTFTATTGSMLHPRQHHAALLLADGHVLLLGGSNPTDGQLASAEIFDPATGSFTAVGTSLAVAREFATATALPNGDVLVTGGTGSGGITLNSAELYTNGAFGAQAFLMRSARAHHTATLLPSGQVLLAGGNDGFTALASAELYTGGSTNSSFTPVSEPMSTARQQHTSTLLASGKILLAGGTSSSTVTGTAELFDPIAGTFTAVGGNLVTARLGAGAALLQSGKVLLAGGTDVNSTALASAEIFDPADGITPSFPSLSLQTPSTAAFGSAQIATITLPSNATAIWSVENGTVNSGIGTNTLAFTTRPSGTTTVYVLVYTSAGLPILASQAITGY